MKILKILISLLALHSTISLAASANGACPAPVSEQDAIAACDRDIDLPNPNPLGSTDAAANCQAGTARCMCYPMKYWGPMMARHGCLCGKSAALDMKTCTASCYRAGRGAANACPPPSNVNHGSCMMKCRTDCVASVEKKKQACISEAPLRTGALGTALDMASCVAKLPACVTGIMPVKPNNMP